MSEHLIEDLVADSVQVLDGHTGQGSPRDWFAALYAFESGFDCSFTRFRVLDVLLRHGFTYRFPLGRHPDFAARSAHLTGLTEFTALREFDEDAPDFAGYDSWLEDGYVDPPWLYCDAGTALWHRMVTSGELAAAPLRRIPLVEVVREVAAAAEQHQDRELIGLWYAFGSDVLVGSAYAVDELAEMPAVRDLREIVRRTDALAIARESPYACPVESGDDEDPEAWWWQL